MEKVTFFRVENHTNKPLFFHLIRKPDVKLIELVLHPRTEVPRFFWKWSQQTEYNPGLAMWQSCPGYELVFHSKDDVDWEPKDGVKVEFTWESKEPLTMSTYDDWKTTPPDDDPEGDAWWESACDWDVCQCKACSPDVEDGRWPDERLDAEYQDRVCQDLMANVDEFLTFGTFRQLIQMISES